MLNFADNGRLAVAAIAAASIFVLGTALVAQYGFGLMPCELCLAQRPPYVLTTLLALLALMPGVAPQERRIVVLLCAVLFAVDAGIAGYHAGVEWKWWRGPTACTGGLGNLDFSNLAAALEKPGAVMCDQPAFVLFGLSMAGYNFIAASTLALSSAWAATRSTWWSKP